MKTDDTFEGLTDELIQVGELLRGRRGFIKAGMITGAASAFAMMAANGVLAADKKKDKKGGKGGGDVALLNTALGLEYQAIYAYTVAASTGLLSDAVKPVALLFQSQHAEHADLEATTIKKLGGTPVAKQEKYDLGDLSGIKSEADLLGFALGLEAQAANTYLSVTGKFTDTALIPVVAGIGANEAQHAALLRYVLKQNPVPKAVVG
ncbi:MAG TPA: ferritin-like domain-containing protein [Blastocatellia bacterium]|nr:ferritin-like domain-containing protein [Blastocatellia bacterium]